jgi:phosphoenolpyruvate---glycerone phosphotransferase subunit DhaL
VPSDGRLLFLDVARRVQARQDELNDADRAIGDGDHGLALARGFEAVERELETGRFDTVGDLLNAVGRALLSAMGGASGVLYATLFTGGAAQLGEQETFDGEALRRLLVDGTAAVRRRGKANPGDKTMVDALAPAAQRALELPGASLAELLPEVAEAARRGMEQTKEMVARTGKTRALGERSLGHPDPGALSSYVILESMAEHVAERPP